jgi:hypothetical protein
VSCYCDTIACMAFSDEIAGLRARQSAAQSKADSFNYNDGASSPAGVAAFKQSQAATQAVNAASDKQIRSRWFDNGKNLPATDGQIKEPKGILEKGLDVLSMPARAVMGAVKYGVGDSKETSLGAAVNANVTADHTTAGDLLKKHGVHYSVAAPAGFALDVLLDPVNWATAGTSALIPRIGQGLVKGGLEGAAIGAASGVQRAAGRAAQVSAALVGQRKPLLASDAFKSFAENTLKKVDRYDEIIDKNPMADLTNAGPLADASKTLFKGMQDIAKSTKIGEKVYETFRYSPKDWFLEQKMGNLQAPRTAQQYEQIGFTALKDTPERRKAQALTLAGRDAEAAPLHLIADAVDEKNLAAHSERIMADAAAQSEAAIKKQADAEFELTRKAGIPDDEAKRMQDLSSSYAQRLQDEHGMTELDAVMSVTTSTGGAKNVSELEQKVLEVIPQLRSISLPRAAKEIDNAATILHTPETFISPSGSVVERLTEESSARLGNIITETAARRDLINEAEKTGVAWYDNARKFTREKLRIHYSNEGNRKRFLNVGAAFLNTMQTMTDIMKTSKVILNPASIPVSVISNMFMDMSLGLRWADPKLLARRAQASKVYLGIGNSDNFLDEFLNSGSMQAFTGTQDKLFSSIYGESAHVMRAKRALNKLKTEGGVDGIKVDEESVRQLLADAKSLLGEETFDKAMASSSKKRIRLDGPSAMETASKNPDRSFAGFTGEELARSRFFSHIKEVAEKGNPDEMKTQAAKMLNSLIAVPASGFEAVDGTFRMGGAAYMTLDGLTELELKRVGRFVQIDPLKDVVGKVADGTEWRYKITAEKATEIASEAYLNYGAMPGAVKVLKSMPFFGAPFASFMYGMMHKTGKTVLYNPAMFNRIDFGKHEFAGTKSEGEKRLIETRPNFSFYGNNEMFRLPFFEQYPLYMSTKNMIPFYSINVLNPTERGNSDSFGGMVTQIVDKLPILKDPAGSVLWDYLVLPHLMGEASPQGIFGQPIYPKEADTKEKFLYAARALVEPMVPTGLGLAGFVAPNPHIPGTETTSLADIVPLARYRQAAYAKEGKNSYGLTGKESAASRSMRNIAAGLGFPIQAPMDVTQVDKGN